MTRQNISVSTMVVLGLLVAGSGVFLAAGSTDAEDRLDQLERLSTRAKKARADLELYLKEQAELKRIAKEKEDLERAKVEAKAREKRLKAIAKIAAEKEKRLDRERKEARKRAEMEAKVSEQKGSARGERYYKGTKFGRSSFDYSDSNQAWVREGGRYVPGHRTEFGPYMEIGGNVNRVGHSGRTGTFRGRESGGRGLSIGVRARVIRLDDPDRF